MDFHTEFNKGLAIETDPTNDAAIQSGGNAVTSLYSFWLHKTCPECTHTFRLGDEVFIASDRSVKHNSVTLPCASNERKSIDSSDKTSEFFKGLDESWPPPKDIPILRLEAGHELLAPSKAGFKRHRCLVCGHTFRLYDHVIICPCSPNNLSCRAAIHRDPIHGLNCYQAWNPGANKQQFCPVTSRKLNE